ncbi:MAG TPA: glycosyltransferase family 2 protein [Candidatus Diapherotrites archaeon]|uniref:Glycosyltransferase family 2 protein n=1 Tax=Candidatus Iainarchaeum sp. TaxID=3101447 RepID=A0A7J4JFR2_9ARCH|nr:glycosyltransferase family 2 protein [Candidatus Diapherotrites archaeon]
MPKPLASVVVVTFNRLALLQGCLAALRRQTCPDFEIIVVNGASVDGTKDFLAKQSEIQVINQLENRGLSESRNAGIQAAKGEIVVFVDDDCVMDEGWLGKLLAPYADPGVAGVGGKVIGLPSRRVFFDHGGVDCFGIVQTLHAKSSAGFHPYLAGCNMSFRRSVLDVVGFFDEAFFLGYDETDLCIRIQHAGSRLVFNDDAAICHHIHVEGKHDSHRFYWKARSRRLLMFKNFWDEIGWRRLLIFEVVNLWRNLYRFLAGCLGVRGRKPVSWAELWATLRGAWSGYGAGLRLLLVP